MTARAGRDAQPEHRAFGQIPLQHDVNDHRPAGRRFRRRPPGSTLAAVLGEPAVVQGFAAVDDATYLERGGIPAISYGPGNIMVCHAVDEHVVIDEVVKACKVYTATAIAWCGLA
jgi:hypothetical protein